jgi:uncharacterized membrane protein YgcG
VRAGTVVALTSAPLLAAGSAFATDFQGEDAGPRISVLQTIGIFVGIPVGLFLVITFLVMLPGWVKGDSNRTEIGWDRKSAAKTETAAPQDAAEASAEAEAKAESESGEKAGAGSGTSGTGGASGSW